MPTTTNYAFYSPPLTGVTPNPPRDIKTLADGVDVALKAEETARIAGDVILSSSRWHSAATSITTATWTTIPFDTSELDEITWDSGNSRFNAPTAGYYQINCAVLFQNNATNIRGLRIVQGTGATVIATTFTHASVSSNLGVSLSRGVKITAADVFYVQCYQASGSSLTLGGSGRQVFVDITRVGR